MCSLKIINLNSIEMSKIDVIVGTQWGDEGKGKITHALSIQYDYVVRFSGGPNAGHTIDVGGNKIILHTAPVGIIHGKDALIAPGTLIDLATLKDEMEKIHLFAPRHGRLYIAGNCRIILPYHKLLDKAREEKAAESGKQIGTTQKGIGPAYADSANRHAITFAELFDDYEQILRQRTFEIQAILARVYDKYDEMPNPVTVIKELRALAEEFRQCLVSDVSESIYRKICLSEEILAEGSQGARLDILHGDYPYCTSSSTLAGNVCPSLGIGPKHIGKVIGVLKAYATRVGEGPFPGEIFGVMAQAIQEKGGERGATTGRLRRVGWLNLQEIEKAIILNGIDELALTKLDVLSGLGDIIVLDTIGKERSFSIPTFTGGQYRSALPEAAREFVEFIERELGVPITIIGTGTEEKDIIFC